MAQEQHNPFDPRADTPSFVKTIHKDAYSAIDPTQTALSAAGKTVLITGGATGIGYSIARNFAAAGASTIVLLARRAPTLEEASAAISKAHPSVEVLTYATDINDAQAVSDTLDAVVKTAKNKSIDIIATSAIYGFSGAPTIPATETILRDMLETNVFGNLSIIRKFISLPSSNQKIILDVSTSALWNPFPMTGVYGASKYVTTHILRHIQIENPELRIHSFHPGAIETPAVHKFGFDLDKFRPYLDNEELPGRFAVWLASPQAEFLKGKMVLAKWDVEDLMKNKEAFKDPNFSTVGLHVGA